MHECENRELVLKIISESLERLDPFNVVANALTYDSTTHILTVSGRSYILEEDRGLWILGGGKAAAAMGKAVESVLGNRIHDGILITPKGAAEKLQHIQLMEGTHPLPGKDSLAATYELTDLAAKIPAGDNVICLISGGTSALMCLPAGDLEPAELADTYRLLLRSGADIHKMNVVRTVLSRIKGGGLLSRLAHTSVIDLIISDVPGDDFKSIGSGPTTPVERDYKQAFQILKTCGIWNDIPHEVRTFITKGMYNPVTESHEFPVQHDQFLVSSAGQLANEVAKICEKLGFETDLAKEAYNIPISELESLVMEKIHRAQTGLNGKAKKQAIILFGESSVEVTGSGKGGRNQELALRVSMHLNAHDRVTFASIGTDGVDGPTDAAGAVVDGQTKQEAGKLGLKPEMYLANNDSYHFFEKAGGLIRTGPTGNNLMDLQVILSENGN